MLRHRTCPLLRPRMTEFHFSQIKKIQLVIMEIYIKGKYENGVGASAYVVVADGEIVAQGGKCLGPGFTVAGQQFPCDQFNTEVLAAICGIARCEGCKAVNVYSNNKSVIAWLARGGEPDGRRSLLDIWRRYADGMDVFVEYIPYFERDETENMFNRLCDGLAMEALKS